MKIIAVAVLLALMMGCETRPTVFYMGDKVRLKGTSVEGRVYYDCYENESCQVSYSHGKFYTASVYLEKLQENNDKAIDNSSN